MPKLSPTDTIDFHANNEQYHIVQTKINAELHLIAVISIRQRWDWKNDVNNLETEIIQFLGNSAEDVTSQCNEWLKTISAATVIF